MGGEEAEPKAVRHPVLTRRSIVTGKEFLDFGRITFTQHKTTQTAEFLLCKEATLKSKIVAHMNGSWELNKPGGLLRAIGNLDTSAISADHVENVL